MSMQEMLDAAQRHMMLRFWKPLLPRPRIRMLYVAGELVEEIQFNGRNDYRMGQLHRDFDFFCQSRRITVGLGREATCFMKPLEPVEDEVWELRSRDPEPQVRVFGRFALPDCFVATHAAFRDDLGDLSWSRWEGNNWPIEIQRCKSKWAVLLPSQIPFSGGSIHAYITRGAVDLSRLP
jgi:hypothetical protein